MLHAIKKLRTKHGLTQDELAAKLQVEKIRLSRWERNWDVLPEALVKDIAVLFNTSAGAYSGPRSRRGVARFTPRDQRS